MREGHSPGSALWAQEDITVKMTLEPSKGCTVIRVTDKPTGISVRLQNCNKDKPMVVEDLRAKALRELAHRVRENGDTTLRPAR